MTFPTLKNDRFLKSLRRQPVDRTPIWIMRQAGRYLPEYRATRAKAGSFLDLCMNKELACEVTLQPLERYPLDAAILFSDILTIPHAMGLGLHFVEGEGPKFEKPIQTIADIEKLPVDVQDDLNYVTDAVGLIRQELDGRVPLIGFTGSPWTLATYMIEGQSTREFKLAKRWIYSEPEALHMLLDKVTQAVITYLSEQIKAGAQAVQVFDTWGGALSESAYESFSLRYMREITQAIKAQHPDVPVILFTKGGGSWLEQIADTGCDAMGLDWSVNIGKARARLNDRVALQGNMDPAILRAPAAVIESEVQAILRSFGDHNGNSGHVFNLGHGITPDIDPEHTAALVQAVIAHSATYHTSS